MKLHDYFAVLLNDTVNLSKLTVETTLPNRVDAIYNALKADAVLGPFIKAKHPQGSWAHRTIIKPAPGKEFDADFLLEFIENPDWADDPKRYIEEVYAALGRSTTYKTMTRTRKCRCVRVVYAESSRCHVDIVPYLFLADGREVIVNRDDNDWEDTKPDGFTEWMKAKDDTTGGDLRRVLRLLKYLRDHRSSFSGTRSIILTTIVGERVNDIDRILGRYADLPTSLVHIVEALDNWLQANPTRPSIPDPSGSGLTFDHRWPDDASYGHLRDRIHQYAPRIRAAYDETDKDTSIELWQEIFGDGFHAPPPKESSGRFAPVAPVPARPSRAG